MSNVFSGFTQNDQNPTSAADIISNQHEQSKMNMDFMLSNNNDVFSDQSKNIGNGSLRSK